MKIAYLHSLNIPEFQAALEGHDVEAMEFEPGPNAFLPADGKQLAKGSDLAVVVFSTPEAADDFHPIKEWLDSQDLGDVLLVGIHPEIPTHSIEGPGIPFRHFGSTSEAEEILRSLA